MNSKITGTPLSALKYEITSAHNYHSHEPTRRPILDYHQPGLSLKKDRYPHRLPLLNQPKMKIAKFKLNGGRDNNKFQFRRNDKEGRTKKVAQIFKETDQLKSTDIEKATNDSTQRSNFPFPANYKKIDFNKINPYKLAVAAEFLAREKKRLEEPFLKHTEKMEQFANRFDETVERNKYMLNTSPIEALRKAKKEEKFSSRIAVISHEPYSDLVREKSRLKANLELSQTRQYLEEAAENETDRLIIRDKNSPGHYWIKSKPNAASENLLRNHDLYQNGGKANADGYTSVYLPNPETVQNVQNWLSANFSVKPVPLILHPPKIPNKFIPKASESNAQTLKADEEEQDDYYGLRVSSDHRKSKINKKEFDRSELRELHIINGLVKSPKIIHGAVQNSFARGYDLTPVRNLMEVTRGPIQPHFFRFILGLEDFYDNEIVFQTRKNILYVTARSAGKPDGTNPRKIEEIIELPEGVTIKNLKFYRSTDHKIVIEEIASVQIGSPGSVGLHLNSSRYYN